MALLPTCKIGDLKIARRKPFIAVIQFFLQRLRKAQQTRHWVVGLFMISDVALLAGHRQLCRIRAARADLDAVAGMLRPLGSPSTQ